MITNTASIFVMYIRLTCIQLSFSFTNKFTFGKEVKSIFENLVLLSIYANADGLLVLTGLTGNDQSSRGLIHKVARSISIACKILVIN